MNRAGGAAGRRKKLVLYYPHHVDESQGETSSRDLIPLALLAIAAWPERDGYEVVIVDGNLYPVEEAHRRVVLACEGALLYATTGILGFQVADGYRCTRRVKAAYPSLPAFIGGWWASAAPEMQLATGLYDAVCVGQGELTFRELVQAVDAGEPLESVAGLALSRDGALVRTAPRAVVGWNELLDNPWHLVDFAPYRDFQRAQRGTHPRLAVPPGYADRPFSGISYYASFGCPEPCTFCCSPEMSGMRWKAMPAARMLDDLCALKERWGFEVVRFVDANFGVAEKRVAEFCEGLLERDLGLHWYGFMQASSIVRYKRSTLVALPQAGMFDALVGAETGDHETMLALGKHSKETDNFDAAVRLAEQGICSFLFYIIGYPDETPEQMLASLDECRRVAAATPLARPTVWPFRPIPGTALWPRSLAKGFAAPDTLEGWGTFVDYHHGEADSWPGQIPPEVDRARRLFEHYYTLSVGLARGEIGWWERRARARIASGSTRFARLEAKAFDLCAGLARRLNRGRRGRIRPGAQTSAQPVRSPA